ncbi:MAG: iron ABC transporter permease [Gemmatimonadota bacterium]
MALTLSSGRARLGALLHHARPALKSLRPTASPWSLAAMGAVGLVLLPLATVFLGILGGGSETWDHLASTVLREYMVNSAILMVVVGGLSLLLGISTAWLVTACDFPGRRLFRWSLVLPLSMPTYIVAFAYAGLFGHGAPLLETLAWGMGPPGAALFRSRLLSIWGVSAILALVLYPYVYLITRASFLKQAGGLLESSRVLGRTAWDTFFRVALPLARPAWVAGVTLVLMEVLNEYGAVRYYGVPTFTTGIFRAWFSLGDAAAALRLAGVLLVFVFALMILERVERGRARFDEGSRGYANPPRFHLRGWRAAGAFGACAIPVTLGFLLPALQLLGWGIEAVPNAAWGAFLSLAANSFGLALVSALLCVSVALLIVYAARLDPSPVIAMTSRVSVLGYSIPGAVIALGVLLPFVWMDTRIDAFLRSTAGISSGLLITGTVAGLTFAYLVRFLAVAHTPVESGFTRICGRLDETSRSLGHPPLRTLWEVNLPLLRGTLLSAGLLVFVDVLKELPLTLILRPFNFDTLATRAFQLASDEMLAQAALPALLIVLSGLGPVLLLSRLISRGER